MAVTKAQIAQWSAMENQRQKAAAEPMTKKQTTAAPVENERVSREQIRQWHAETAQKASGNVYADALDEYRANHNLGFASEMDSRNDTTPQLSWYGKAAQQFKAGTEVLERKSDRLDALNQWYDDPRNQQLVADLTAKKDPFTTYAQQGTSRNAASAPAPLRLMGNSNYGLPTTPTTESKYTDKQLEKRGYSAGEIGQGRQYLKEINEIPEAKQQARRILNTAGGIADTVEAAPLLAGEYIVQAGRNFAQSAANRKALEAEVARSPREKNLYEALLETDMDYRPKYSVGDLLQQGFTRDEIDSMKARIAGTEAKDSIDPEQSLGYQIYNRGQKLNAAAQSGLGPAAKAAQGIVSSAAENLVVGSVNPALVLPVLSAQGAVEAMGQSVEKNESAGKALAGGLAKFGAGWAINSVGAADLARSMGSDYAKDTMAGQIADWVRGLAGDGTLAQNYPAVANALSGGIDNAMQAFVETYADQAIDAALGDKEAARTMFDKDTFLTALESGLSGGASGALGGAVGTGLGAMRERAARAEAAEQAQAEDARQRKAWERSLEPGEAAALAAGTPTQTANAANTEQDAVGRLNREATETVGSERVNENPAVQQFAEAAAEGSLTGKTVRLFAPEAGNEANRAAFEEAYGVQLPDTAAATRRMLRDIAAQQQATPTAEAQIPAGSAESGNKSAEAVPETALPARESPENVRDEPEIGMGQELARAVPQAGEQAVEKPGETVENATVENAPMRETYGLEAPKTQEQKVYYTEQKMRGWDVSEKAAKHLSQQLPKDVNADTYVAAASSLYRLGQMEDVDTFDKALRLAGSENALGLNVNEVLSQTTGRNALEQAYLYGKGEREARAERMQQLGGVLGPQSTSGEGVTYYEGTVREMDSVGSRIIQLNAQGTGTDAVLKNVLNGPDGAPNPNVKACVDTKTARIFFGDRAENVFQTVLHEDYHWYNTLDSEGAKTLQDHALQYLAKSSGYENIDELIRAKMGDYAAQKLTYEQAAEELVADAWGGIFDSEESFRRWAQFQREQAEKNAGKAGTVHKVMQQVKTLLENILSKAKEVLRMDPENAAAQKAKRLAEAEKRALQEEYFAHAEKAMDNLRSAKENAAALKNESAAEGRNIRFSIQKDADGESYIKIDEDILNGVPQEDWKTVVKQAIKERYPNGFERNGWTILNSKDGRNEFVWSKYTKALQWENAEAYADKMRMASNLDEIIKTADEVYREPAHHKNAEAFNRGKIKVMVGPNAYEADVLTAIRADEREIFYDIVNVQPTKIEPFGGTHVESEDSRSRLPKGSIYQESADTVLKTEEGGERPSFPANRIITQNDAPVKKNTRFQLASPVEVNSEKELVAVHNLTEENLREALDLGGMPSPSIAVVKAQAGHSKYGPISLVFGPDSIDPQANRANRVYGSDAWTPTRPNVEYAVNGKALTAFEKAIYNASEDAFEGKFVNSAALQRMGVGEVSSENRTELAQKLQRETAVQLAYLKEKGQTVEPIYKTERETFDSMGNDVLEKVVERAGADEIKNAFESGDFDLLDKLADKAADALEEKYAHGALAGQNKRWQMRIDKLRKENRGRLYGLIEHAYKMLTDTSDGKAMLDVEATREAIREAAPEAQVERWAYDKLGDVLGEKGIRNQKDRFTRGGKSRSFAELHNPYTLENLVAAMNAQNARGQDVWGLSASTLMSTTTAEYKNLDEVRADKGRLQQMPEEEYKTLLEKADNQIEAVISKLRSETEAHADNSFEEREILGDILLRAAQGSQTTAAIGKAFAKEGYSISKDTAALIRKLYKDVAAIPTGYFEAKPQRAVGFDEVKAAILPDNASPTLVDSLREHGVAVQQYKAGDETQRAELLNKVPNVRFQLAENADKEARKNTQRQASRAIAEQDASLKTLMDFFGITRGVRISDDSMESLALKTIYAAGAKGKMNATEFAGKLRPLVEYMKADGADMSKAQSMAEVLAGEALDHATTRNTELWDQYPELHSLSYTVAKDGQAEKELVRRYGSWGAAVKDARSHGVQLRREAGTHDGNPAEQYESIVNDTRAVGGVKDGTAALFRHAAESAGVAGASSMESTEWLDVLMNVHDAIKPRMMSRFADAAEYEDAKVELAGQMLGNVMDLNEMKDVQAIFDGIQKHNRAVAVAAAGSEERAAEVLKGLKSVQKEQTRLFNQKLRENSRPAARSEDARAAAQQEQRNRQAEKLLDQNLDTLGVDISNIGDLNEKLEVLRETYEREWKAEKKRLRDERRQMLDEIALERRKMKAENAELARQVAGEQRRADRAERQLIFQEDEMREWDLENQQKAAEWYQKQAERNAIAIEVERQQRDEDIAVAKALAEKRAQKARDARKADELKRSIRNNAVALNQMILRPQPGKYVSKALMTQAMEVAKLADVTILNQNAVNRLSALETSIREAGGSKDSTAVSAMSEDWKQSGIVETLAALRADLTASKEAKLARLNEQLAEAEALPDSEKARALQDRLKMRIRETENRTYLPLTVDQLRALKAITTSALHVIRNANKTLSLEKAQEVDAMALTAAHEVGKAKGNAPGEKWSGVRGALTRYNLDMLGGVRVFRMLGGYTKNGQMEQLATMLNDGQRKQTQILVEGEALFDNVTGKSHVQEMERFAGPGADLVDVGLKDTKGNAVPLTHAQLCSLYMHLKNADSRNHLLTGGLTLPDAKLYHKGKIEEAYQKGQNVMLGNLMNADGTPMADTILQTVERALTDYDRAWCEDMKDFFGRYTTNLINETSLKLLGYQRATVKDYYPIAVDKTQLATEIEGLKLDATIEGRGFLKNRQKSAKPILLEECSNVVQRSLRDTAAYAGLAAPLRDVQKVLNSSVETAEGIGILKNKIIQEHWGKDAVNYIDYLLTDLQSAQRKRKDSIGRVMGRLRGNYAGAILTLNPGVAIAQAASLPTAGAVLGADTMAAVVPFVKNLSGKQRAALETEIAQHGDALLRYRMRGAQVGELSSIGVDRGLAQNAMDKLPKSLTGWINSMDEITVAALWEGAKRYVEHHETLQKGSEAYWEAVNKTYQKVIEETQPNYTTMQRAGIQRSDNEITKALTMFTTQRFQNYGILADAVGDYKAQKARYKADASAENKAEVERAGKQLNRAVTSQLTQTAVFALMKIGADFLLHRWDREQDENGDITTASMSKRFLDLYTESFAGNFLFGSELYSLVDNAINGTDYDVVSATNISAVNDTFAAVTKFAALLRKDTGEMDEEELTKYHQKLINAGIDVIEYGFELAGVPFGNAEKMVRAMKNYAQDAVDLYHGEGFSLNGVPGSATGQYDRLYNAVQSGDSEEAQAALDKLSAMGKDEKTITGQLKIRLKKNSPEVEEAAEARNAGNDTKRQELTKRLIREMYGTLGIREGVKEDAAKREQVIDLVTGAINQKGDELLAGGTDGSVYDDLAEALDSGRARDVQDEVNRLLTAGKKPDSLKTKVTSLVKEEYLAGNDRDREKLEAMLLKLTDGNGKPLYEKKNFEQWVKQAKKQAEKNAGTADEWVALR